MTMRRPRQLHPQGSVLIYAVILAAVFGMLGVIIAYKAEMLTNNLDSQAAIAELGFNIDEKANNAREYDMALNRNGSGYTAITECPQYTISGSTQIFSWSSMTMTQSAKLNRLYCEAILTESTKFAIFYGDNGGYSHAQIIDWAIPPAPVVFLSGITYPTYTPNPPLLLWNSYFLKILTGSALIDRDFDCNNDDHSAYVSGSTLCFDDARNSQTIMSSHSVYDSIDDDEDAMLEIFGSTRKGKGYANIFWNSPKTTAFIDNHMRSPNLFVSLSGVTNGGVIHLAFSGYFNSENYYNIMIVSYDKDEFLNTQRLIPTGVNTGSWRAKEGYIMLDTTLWSDISSAKIFSPQNSLFGIFVSYEWPEDTLNTSNNTLDFKMRMYNVENTSPLTIGAGVIIVPLSYSNGEYQFWGSDIRPIGNDHPYREYGVNLVE